MCTEVHAIIAFFYLILASLFSLHFHGHPQGRMGCQETDRIRKEERKRPKKRWLHELPYLEMVKSGTIIDLAQIKTAKNVNIETIPQ